MTWFSLTCTSCRVFASCPGPNHTVRPTDIRDPLITLSSILSGFRHVVSCVCIRPLHELPSVPNRYMRLFHTANDNLHLLLLCSIPTGSLHFVTYASIRPLPEPHSMPNSYMRFPSSSSIPISYLLIHIFLSVSLHQADSRNVLSTQWFFTLLLTCSYQVLAQTAHRTRGHYSVLSYLIGEYVNKHIVFFAFLFIYLFIYLFCF